MSLLFKVIARLSASSVIFCARRIVLTDSKDSEADKDDPAAVPCSLKGEDLELKQKVKSAMQTALETLVSSDGWIKESGNDSNDVIESKRIDGTKVFRVQAVVNTSTDNLMAILFDTFENQPLWNPTVLECKIIKEIDSNTDLAYTVSASACQGMVTSRDFVVVRHKAPVDNSFIIASISVQTFQVPENKTFIRGDNGPSCFLISPVPGKSKQCQLRWLLNTKLNGWLPQSLVDNAFNSVIKDYLKYLRKYIAGLPSDILFESQEEIKGDSKTDPIG